MSPRDKILERRALFVAAALAASTTSCEDKAKACLSAVANEYKDASTAAPADVGVPMPCLTVMVSEDAGPPPMAPCLSVPMPHDAGPTPKVCLSVVAPRDAGAAPAICLSPLPKVDSGPGTPE